ncbi:MAG: hypothetical protein LBT09_16275 [Planctomycetaceae bacterium]|nr:hypothetical protein [Planctomycetaceae bacterium]
MAKLGSQSSRLLLSIFFANELMRAGRPRSCCSELASTGFLFELRSTGATVRRTDHPPANGF